MRLRREGVLRAEMVCIAKGVTSYASCGNLGKGRACIGGVLI
jgi:hypothetical protein